MNNEHEKYADNRREIVKDQWRQTYREVPAEMQRTMNTRTCPCGQPVRESDRYCSRCGRRLEG